MRALTVRHPWALALALGVKPVENRSKKFWRAEHVGTRIAIHASNASPAALIEAARLYARGDWHLPADVYTPEFARTAGCILAVATLDRVIEHGDGDPMNFSRWRSATDRFGLVVREVVRLAEPVPAKGALGFWTVPPEVEARVRAQAS